MPISPDHLAIYFNAAVATAAYQFGIAVERLSLRINARRRERPLLAPLADYVKSCGRSAPPGQPYIDYATVLLAGSAGRFLGLEAFLAYPRPHLDVLRLQRAHLAEATLCLEPETDRAFAIIVARLSHLDDGDAETTFASLWGRALQLLRQPDQQRRMAAVVAAFRQRRELQGQEILAILSS